MSNKGYKVQPLPRVPRHDIVQVCLLFINQSLILLYLLNNNNNKIWILLYFCVGCTTWKPWEATCFLWSCAKKLACELLYEADCGCDSWLCVRGDLCWRDVYWWEYEWAFVWRAVKRAVLCVLSGSYFIFFNIIFRNWKSNFYV